MYKSLILLIISLITLNVQADKPNVIFILTDDQGYNDLGHNGNPYVKTPNIDKLADQSTRFDDFHVLTCCAPSRAMLMTGRYAMRGGVWCTVGEACRLSKHEVTMADIFKENGYKTALFGKWHLGDNYPFRPQDRGFDDVLWHGAGGVGNTPDFWANSYFDDTYMRAEKGFEKHKGFCTDVWFNEAAEFIEKNKDKPFFCYISVNAPHLPFVAPEKYLSMYPNEDDSLKAFYGMITNIDDNVGKLRQMLKQLNISKNTILIFSTDNGSVIGMQRYNAGMSGHKRTILDGGHRVPLIIHWPDGGMDKKQIIKSLTSGIDLLPSLIDLCQLKKSKGPKLDGRSFKPLIEGKNWPERIVFVQNQWASAKPVKWHETAVLTSRWRLLNNTQLYDIKADSMQKENLYSKYPEVVKKLSASYDTWWNTLKDTDPAYGKEIIIGSDSENPLKLTGHDNSHLWNHDQVLEALRSTGSWNVFVEKEGKYEIELRRYPKEANAPLLAQIPVPKKLKNFPYKGPSFAMKNQMSAKLAFSEARLKINHISLKEKIKSQNASTEKFSLNEKGEVLGVKFYTNLKQGNKTLSAEFLNAYGNVISNAYYIYIKRLGK